MGWLGRAALGVGIVLVCMGCSRTAFAQIFATPSLAVSERYDDNVRLSSTNPESDFVTVVSPGLRLELQDHPWYITLAGSLRGEFFAKRTELNTTTDNREGSGSIEYRATRTLTLSVTDTFVQSSNPGEVDPQTGIVLGGRTLSTGNTISPVLSYQVDPRTSTRLLYSFRTLSSDSPLARDSTTHEGAFTLQRQLTRRTDATFSYSFSRFEVEQEPSRDSHSPRLGFIFAYSPTVSLSSSTGVVLLERADGTTEVSLATASQYAQQFKRGNLALAYDRGGGVGGLIGVPTVTQTVSASGGFQATRELTLAANGRLSETSGQGVNTLVSSVDVRASYRFLRWLSVEASYRYLHQDDRVGRNDVTQNVLSLGLTASDRFRLY